MSATVDGLKPGDVFASKARKRVVTRTVVSVVNNQIVYRRNGGPPVACKPSTWANWYFSAKPEKVVMTIGGA